MQFFRDLSIRHKLTFAILLASAAALLLAGAAFIAYDRGDFREQLRSSMRTRAQILANASTGALSFHDQEAVEEYLYALRADRNLISATIFTPSGEILGQYVQAAKRNHFQPPKPEPTGSRFEPDRMIVFQTIHQKGVELGTVVLQRDLLDMHERLVRFLLIGAGVLLGALALAWLVGAQLQHYISRPLLQLAETANVVAHEHNYALRARKTGRDELGSLTDRFNEMLGQIQSHDADLQRAHDQLEQRVKERTRDLEAEVGVRLRSEAALRANEERLRRQNQTLVNLATLPVQAETHLEVLFHKITEATAQVLQIERASIWLYNPTHTGILCHDLFELTPARHSQGVELMTEQYPRYFAALAEARTITATDARIDPRTSEFTEGYLNPLGITAMLDAPIRLGGRVLGVVCCEHVGPPREWMTDEQTFAGSVADLVALVLEAVERHYTEQRNAAFSELGRQLSIATTPAEAANAILTTTDKMLGWDAAFIDLTATQQHPRVLLCFDVVDGQRQPVTAPDPGRTMPFTARVLADGPQLVLRSAAAPDAADLQPFGETSRRSASLLFVPIRHGMKNIGVLSVQSYTRNAYDAADLKLLQSLVDLSSGALERIHAETALNQSEQRFGRVFNASSVPKSIVRRSDSRVLEVNDFWVRQTGYTREEVLGRTGVEIGTWVEPAQREEMLCRFAEHNSVRDMEVKFRYKSGTIRHCLLSVEPLEFAHEPCMLMSTHDITERLSLEAQLRQSQKMEAIGQLAAGVAHDFNNILTVIMGNAGLLRESHLDPVSADSLAQIISSAERASNLTRQLLTFSRKQVMQLRLLDLNEVAESTAKMLRRLLGETITLQLNFAPERLMVNADAGMLDQIILNLAVNARDAMPNGGQLILQTNAVEFPPNQPTTNSDVRPGKFTCLSLRDTGCGMDTETLAHIFEPFFTTKEVGKGTGLGLATVYGIAKQHDGWVEVTSQPGAGTEFKVFIPRLPTPASSGTEIQVAPKISGGKETILVVEDEKGLRLLVKTVLEKFGYRVYTAEHGRAALDIWQQHAEEIDLLLTDMVMPESISGAELAAQLRQARPGLKVIYTSGYSVTLAEKAEELRAHGAFLPKPYHARTLAKIVRDCLDGRTT